MKKFKWIYLGLILYVVVVLYTYLHYLLSAGFFMRPIFTIADLLVEVSKPGFYLKIMFLPLMLGMINQIRKYRKYTRIIQYKKRNTMLKEQIKNLLLWSMLLTICIMVTTMIVGMQMQKDFINWGKYASYFAVTTGHILPHINFVEVFAFYTFLIICKNMMIGMLLMGFFWIGDSILFGVLAGVSITILSWLGNEKIFHIPWIYFYGDYSFFTNPFNIVKGILWMLIYFGSLLFLQYRFLENKNF